MHIVGAMGVGTPHPKLRMAISRFPDMELSIKAVGWMEESFKSIIPVDAQDVQVE